MKQESLFEMNATVTTDCGIPSQLNCTLPTRLPDSIHPAVDYVQATIVLITMLIGISMNGFVVFLICRHKILHKMAFFLALQLIVAHLIFSCTVLPFMFVTAVLREWRLGVFMCQLLGSIHDVAITSRYLLTFVLTIDRLVSVFFPFFYLQQGVKVSVCNSVFAWIVSIIRSVTSLKGVLSCTNYVPPFKMCSGAAYCSNICQVHTLFFSAILAIFGVVIPFLFYAALFCKAKIIKYHLKRTIPPQQTSARSTKEDEQHNHRATITFLILTLVIIGCALPPYILYTAQFIQGANASPVVVILQILVGRTLIYSLAAADPIVIMRNRDVRELLQSKFCGPRASRTAYLRRFSLSSITTSSTAN